VAARTPSGVGIAQDRQAEHRQAVAFEEAVAVQAHPQGEVGVALGLHLDVQQHQGLLAALELDPDHQVHLTALPPRRGLTRQRSAQMAGLAVQEDRGDAPVDGPVDRGEEELQEVREVGGQRFLPDGVEVVAGPAQGGHLLP